MSNLRDGIITINGKEIKVGYSVSDVENTLEKEDIDTRHLKTGTTIIEIKNYADVDGRKFNVKMFFKNGVIGGMNLQIYRTNRLEFDFWEWIAKNRNWFIEQLGKSDGIKEEVIFSWGKASFWVDERSRDGGISIYYAPK